MEDNVQDIQHDEIVLGNLFGVLFRIHVLDAGGQTQVL